MAKRGGKSTNGSASKQQDAERLAVEAVRELLRGIRPKCRQFTVALEDAILRQQSGTFRLAVRLSNGVPESVQLQTDEVTPLDTPRSLR